MRNNEADMSPPEHDPIDTQLFWTNIVGLGIVFVLLGLFTWLYGAGFLSMLVALWSGIPDNGH
jgi:hypothetical protein